MHRLKLYITGRTHSSQCALDNIRRILDEHKPGGYEIAIVDVVEHPEEAETNRILATPTLIKESPPPVRRIIGDMSDSYKVLLGLGLSSASVTKASH